ncbi:hypothetical protein [Arthrobacter crystallopoietes]|uniref:hypothetical protein n=1 Tax=Crystallibacter crystallopoietes TaxID=37928 RepID=UPI001305170F|nr:hypothetical protein [Arthrobacter crystallopoietes]
MQDVENLRELAVRAHGVDVNGISAALQASGLGTVEGDHAWLDVEGLRRSGPAELTQWREGFDGMISYAGKQGWLNEDRTRVRAHLEHLG